MLSAREKNYEVKNVKNKNVGNKRIENKGTKDKRAGGTIPEYSGKRKEEILGKRVKHNRISQKRRRRKRIRQACVRIGILCAIQCALLLFIRFFTGSADTPDAKYHQIEFLSESGQSQRNMTAEEMFDESNEAEKEVQQSNQAENLPEKSGKSQSFAEESDQTKQLSASRNEENNISPDDNADWKLTLVNPWNTLPEDYEISLKTVYGSYQVDSRCYKELTEMLKACEEAGLSPRICSAYRTMEKQESLYQEKVEELLRQGMTMADARREAATSVAYPGTSEHQLGLAVDIVDSGYQLLVESQENTPVQQWLIENSWEYGFILRYPKDKCDLTGIIYEPWHYRYVGKEAAEEIHARNICLEEYLAEPN